MAPFFNFLFTTPFSLLLFFTPLIYVLNIRSFHRLCENNMNIHVTNFIKNITPIPSELTVRTVLMSYSLMFTMLILEELFSFAMLLLSWLF